MKKTLFLLGLFFLFIGTFSPVQATEDEGDLDFLLDSLDIEEDYRYEFPVIDPAVHLHLGYRLAELSGLSEVFEYEYLEDSVTAGAELRMFMFPHRLFLDVDFANKEDYFGDLRYAYGDFVLFRWLNNSFYHNLENIRLYDYDPLTPNPAVDGTQDAAREYGISDRENKFHLMVRAPRFPLHAYFDGFYMAKEGDTQQRNLLGSGYFNNMLLSSQSRSLDTLTSIYKFGVNSHLGLVEVDFSHTEKRFDVDKDPVLVESYGSSGVRPAGDYQLSRIPELEGSGNTLKVHSSHTGQWVASATLLQNKRENNYSGANSEVIIGTGSVRWSPLTSLALALRYTHKDLDNESPTTLPVSYSYTIKQPVSSKTDTLSLTGRYKPVKGLSFRAKYVFRKINRTNAGLWNLTDSTTKNGITLTADSRLHSKVLFNVKYAYQNISDPAYNTDPEHSHTGGMQLTWLPHPKANILISYDFNHQERNNINFKYTDEPWYREVDMNNLFAMGTFQVSKKFTLNASYSYLQYEVLQDMVYENGGALVDRHVPFDQRAHVITFGAHYRVSDALYLLGEVTTTRSEGGFSPNADDLVEPVSIASFSRMEQRYFLLHLGAEYKVSEDLSLDLDYRFGDFEDGLDNIYDDIDDGEAHIVLLSATKKW